jgi:hypothetical protein
LANALVVRVTEDPSTVSKDKAAAARARRQRVVRGVSKNRAPRVGLYAVTETSVLSFVYAARVDC